MLSFFKVNANYQWVSLIVLLGLIRVPMLLSGVPLLIPELEWMLVGEKMGQGFLLYRDIWDNTSPLSAVIYWLIDAVFGRSQIAYQIIGAFFGILQALYFNYIANERQYFKERNFIPGLVYIVFLNLAPDFNTLSPALMATTFLLLSFGTLTAQIQREKNTENVFEIGFYLGIATLFYLPSLVFAAWAFLALTFYTGSNFRQHTLAFFGFVFPLALTFMFFFFKDALPYFNRNLLGSVFRFKAYQVSDFVTIIISYTIPLVIGVIGFFRTIGYGRYLNYQIRCQQIMMLWFVIVLFSIALMSDFVPMQFIIFLPPLVFFTVHLFYLFRKKIVAEITFLALLCTILLINYKDFAHIFSPSNMAANHKIDNIVNQKIVVIGKNEGEYVNNFLATPYLDWDLAKYDLENVEDYESVISIYDSFTNDPPTYIIDKLNVMERIFRHLPEMAKRYKPAYQKGIYVLNNSNTVKSITLK